MFNFQKKQPYINGFYDIVANYCCLINDDSNDILYTGTNKYSSRILGSILFENEENLFLRYIHSVITDNDFFQFINKKISLREIINNCPSVFIVDKDYNYNIINSALLPLTEIPDDYLPLNNSFCPDFVKKTTLDYSFSLKGDLADLHKAEPLVMSDTNSKVFSLLNSASKFLEEIGIKPVIYSEVSIAGSFELNFEIELIEQENLYKKPQDDIKFFIYKFLNYLFEKLPNEPDNIIKQKDYITNDLKELFKKINTIFSERNFLINKDSSEKKVIDLIIYSVDVLKDLQYKGYNRIEIGNKLPNGEKIPVGQIKTDYYKTVINKVITNELENIDLIEIDVFPNEYKIQVYSLNKETGNGGAYYISNENVSKIILHLRGKDDYHGTEFTKSLDENISINIKGIGKWKNKNLTEITINF